MISGKFQKFYNGLLEWFVAGLPETKDTYGVRYDKARDMMEEGLKEFILATVKEAQEAAAAKERYVVGGGAILFIGLLLMRHIIIIL